MLLRHELRIAAEQMVGASSAMLVETVTTPLRPACAIKTLRARDSGVQQFMPPRHFFEDSGEFFRFLDRHVPTSTGCPVACRSWILCRVAEFSSSVR